MDGAITAPRTADGINSLSSVIFFLSRCSNASICKADSIAGNSCSTASRSYFVSRSIITFVCAITVAERGSSLTMACSPKKSPLFSVAKSSGSSWFPPPAAACSSASSSSVYTPTLPDVIKYMQSPDSPSRTMTVPSFALNGVNRATICLRSCGCSWLKSGTLANAVSKMRCLNNSFRNCVMAGRVLASFSTSSREISSSALEYSATTERFGSTLPNRANSPNELPVSSVAR